MNTIAIDCGASFLKGACIKDGQIICSEQRKSPVVHRDEPVTEAIQLQALVPMIKDMIFSLLDGEKEVRICFSNEMHGFVLAKEDGSPYTDFISWQKEYGKEECNGTSAISILQKEEYKEDIRKSGMPLRAGLPSCNLLYLKLKGVLDQTQETLYFYSLGDYLVKAIFDITMVCHPTNAAASGLYDVSIGDWNRHYIQAVGKENMVFQKVGEESYKTTLDGVTFYVYPPLGDQQAALLGAGLRNKKDISFNLGTGSQVSVLTDKPEFSDDYQIRPFFFGKYLKSIPFIPSGRGMNVFFRFIKEILQKVKPDIEDGEVWKIMLDNTHPTSDTNLSIDLSFFENPITDHTVGSITNIDEYGLTLGNFMSTLFSQMIHNYLWAADIVGNKEQIEQIVFSGGVARRIGYIRDGIIQYYGKDIKYLVAQDETLKGLDYFCNQKQPV